MPSALSLPATATRVASAGHDTLSRAPSRPGATPPPASPARSRRSQSDVNIAGVPLGMLASCMSDREEDALKRRVVAAVSSPAVCTSEAGRYHFLETRNLNAFLMSIERSTSRPVADRCSELTLALECLVRQSGRAGRARAAGRG